MIVMQSLIRKRHQTSWNAQATERLEQTASGSQAICLTLFRLSQIYPGSLNDQAVTFSTTHSCITEILALGVRIYRMSSCRNGLWR